MLCLVSFFAISLTGCRKTPIEKNEEVVKIVYANWADSAALAHLMEKLLNDMGYDVEKHVEDLTPSFAAISRGDWDIMIDTWVPFTHESYWKEFSANFDELGTWYDKGRIGLVVPKYVSIESINQLGSIKDSLNGKIIGIEPDSGIMNVTAKAISRYDLDFQLIHSSTPAMIAALKSSIDQKKPIVITGWTPHWMFAKFDLKFLEDPIGVYGKDELTKFICRKGFKEELPDVAKFFSNVKFNLQQIGSLMDAYINPEFDTDTAISKWIHSNKDLVDSWKIGIE